MIVLILIKIPAVTMERQPTRPTPVSHHQKPPPAAADQEDTLELCISHTEKESIERIARNQTIQAT